MRKKILTSLLAVGLLVCCATAQVEAGAESCKHESYRVIQVTSRTVTGGYNHTYTGPGGVTKVCAVDTGTYSYKGQCYICGGTFSGTGTFEDHSTNHD